MFNLEDKIIEVIQSNDGGREYLFKQGITSIPESEQGSYRRELLQVTEVENGHSLPIALLKTGNVN